MSQNPQNIAPELTDIFINYRRADTSGHAGRLEADLSRRFPGRVFMDIHTIEVGTDFAEAINREVGRCGALIVMIGNQWLDITDPKTGKRRLDNPNDFVALEIAEALKRNTRVIPVLVEGAHMPQPEELPASLATLVRRNAIEISDTRWDYDVQQLIKVLEKICGVGAAGTTSTGTGDGTIKGTGGGTIKGTGTGAAARWGVAKIAIAAAVAAFLVTAALIIYLRREKEPQPSSSGAAVANQSPSPVGTAAPTTSPSAGGEPEAISDSQRSAVVDLSSNRARFFFPFDTKGDGWTLNKVAKYRWDVRINDVGKQHHIEFSANNLEGADSQNGELEAVLGSENTALNGVWETSVGNSLEWVKEPKMEFMHRVLANGLELTIAGNGIRTILAARPKEANLSMKTPKLNATKPFRAVAIEYP